jgi:hypothetical protein
LPDYVAINDAVYRLATGEQIATLPQDASARLNDCLLSPRATMIAFVQEGELQAYRLPSGEKLGLWEFPGNPDWIKLLEFVGPSSVLTLASEEAAVANLDTGETTSHFDLPDDSDQMAVSPNGEYLATCTPSDLFVYDIAAGRQVARVERPPCGKGLPYADCSCLGFSPDLKELAGLFDGRIVCWSHDGSVVLDQPLPQRWDAPSGNRESLIWVPGGRGWLLFQRYLFDRRSARTVAILRAPIGMTQKARFADPHRLFVPRRQPPSAELIDFPIPWQQIDASLKAMKAGNGLLCPGKALSLKITPDSLPFGNRDEVCRQLAEEIEQVLASRDVSIRRDQPLVMQVQYGESRGRQVEYRKGVWPFAGDPNTAVTAKETRGAIVLTLEAPGHDRPLWTQSLDAGAAFAIRGKVTDKAVREGMFKGLRESLHDIEIPYFVPRGPEHLTLPLVIDLGPGPESSTPDRDGSAPGGSRELSPY